jgi:hypothetical protein
MNALGSVSPPFLDACLAVCRSHKRYLKSYRMKMQSYSFRFLSIFDAILASKLILQP